MLNLRNPSEPSRPHPCVTEFFTSAFHAFWCSIGMPMKHSIYEHWLAENSHLMIDCFMIIYCHLLHGVHSGWKSWKMSLFSEFGQKNWKTIGLSPALAGKAGILFFGHIIINSILR